MKPYALFSGWSYYPRGGWDDFFATFDTPQEAHAHAVGVLGHDWHHVVDLTDGNRVGKNGEIVSGDCECRKEPW